MKKAYQTGDIIKITKEHLKVIKTHRDTKHELSLMFDTLAEKQKIASERFWNTIRDLYPGLRDFDLFVDWVENEITVRGKIKKADG